ncbi:MAG: response regulator transcription factor [Anaerolineae bacterium]|nr:response regulator transcription factor [Anaerolineae bacterium]
MNGKAPIRVLVVDDHEVVRRGLSFALAAHEDLLLAGEAADGQEALEACAAAQPDVILMDIQMPRMNGIEAARLIRQQHPQVRIIALTTFSDEETVRDMLQAGCSGYLLKTTTMNELASAIRLAISGQLTLSAEAVQTLLYPTPAAPQPAEPAVSFHLTERELEVLRWMVEGLNNAEIAAQLVVSRSTVKFHVSSILAKMNVSSRVDAVRLALQSGLAG